MREGGAIKSLKLNGELYELKYSRLDYKALAQRSGVSGSNEIGKIRFKRSGRRIPMRTSREMKCCRVVQDEKSWGRFECCPESSVSEIEMKLKANLERMRWVGKFDGGNQIPRVSWVLWRSGDDIRLNLAKRPKPKSHPFLAIIPQHSQFITIPASPDPKPVNTRILNHKFTRTC